jgi:hypothetical protein
MTKTGLLAGAAAALLLMATGAQAQTFTAGPNGNNIAPFGSPDTQTYGEVFTSPVTGTLDSFTLYLNGAIGGDLFGGVGAWNGTSAFNYNFGESADLYDSAAVAGDHSGAYTFNPNIAVTAGSNYVVFLSVFGQDHSNQFTTTMPLANSGGVFDYFVWNNDCSGFCNGSPTSTQWNYFFNAGSAQTDLTFSVPEPTTWALMLMGFGGLGAALRGRRRAALA